MSRVYGESYTGIINPTVKLISGTTNPVGTMVSIWIGSRYNKTISAEDLETIYMGYPCREAEDLINEMYPEYDGDAYLAVSSLAKMVNSTNLPPLDAINFTFEIDNATIAFREQLVRSRLPQNFWTQTSRTADLTQMDVAMLPSIRRHGDKAVEVYKNAVDTIRDTYEVLSEMGVPEEDIRLMPSSMTHRIYWMVPYRTLKSVLNKRISWIAQADLWSPVILGIINELRSNEYELFADFLGAPSDVIIKDGKIVSHEYDNENYDRYYGRDPQPCDPLWLEFHDLDLPSHTDMVQYNSMKRRYSQIWSDEVLNILGWDRVNPSQNQDD